MNFIKRINEGWSDDYVTDFTDFGFQIEEMPSSIKGKYKGSFVVNDFNDWFSEMTNKMTIEYKVIRANTFFNSSTNHASFEVEIIKNDLDTISINFSNKDVSFTPLSIRLVHKVGVHIDDRYALLSGRLENGKSIKIKIVINTRHLKFLLGDTSTRVNIEDDEIKKLLNMIGAQVKYLKNYTDNEADSIQKLESFKELLLEFID